MLDSKIIDISKFYRDKNAITLDAARADAKTLMPSDAKLVKTGRSSIGDAVAVI